MKSSSLLETTEVSAYKSELTDQLVETCNISIIYACSDRLPHLYESIKEYAYGVTISQIKVSELNSSIPENSFDFIFDEILSNLILMKMILKSPKTGRYFGNDGFSLFRKSSASAKKKVKGWSRFNPRAVEEIPVVINCIETETSEVYNTDNLCEENTYLMVHGKKHEYVKIIEIVDEHLFIGKNERGKTLPYSFNLVGLLN